MRLPPFAAALVGVAWLCAAPARAQRPEFTQQTIFVAPFRAETDLGSARRVTGDLRDAIERFVPKRELRLHDERALDQALLSSGYKEDDQLQETGVLLLAKYLRADEVVYGTVSATKSEVTVDAVFALPRDWRSRQPLPQVKAPRTGEAAQAMARAVAAARAQLSGLRRCENALRASDIPKAIAAAAEAIKAYPAAVFARGCLLTALTMQPTPADSLRHVAEAILAVDTANIVAALERAEALEAVRQTPANAAAAVYAWERVIALRPDSVDLGLQSVDALLRLGQYDRALAASRALATRHPTVLSFGRLSFRALIAKKDWKAAARFGDSLARSDSAFALDSTYAVRQVEALRQSGDTLGALAASARAVTQHPGDALLYTQYVQLVTSESGAALARGLTRFPEATDLYVLKSVEARTAGRRKDAITSIRAALTRDPHLVQGVLQLADLWLEESQPDSAMAALAAAPRDSVTMAPLRAYALARGSRLWRSGSDAAPNFFRQSAPFFALADSLESRDDSRALIAASMLSVARADLLVASKTNSCLDVRRSAASLAVAGAVLDRGIAEGMGGAQLKQNYDAMRAAVDPAEKQLCKGAPSRALTAAWGAPNP